MPLRALAAVLAALLLVPLLLAPVPAHATAVQPLDRSDASGPVRDLPRGVVAPVGGPALGSRGLVVPPGAPAPPQVSAAGWLVADADSGVVLAARDPHGLYAPASTIKVLTALTFAPDLAPDQRLRATADDEGVDGSRVGLVQGVAYPAHEVLEAMVLTSGNDAAQVLARTAGTVDAGVARMNAVAAELGAYDTVARTPHGLDADGQTSSAYDLALLGRAALRDPLLAEVARTRCSDITAPAGQRFQICNHNRLVLDQVPGALGVKNGYTQAARASLVAAQERDGRRLLVTLTRAQPRVHTEALALLDWAAALPRTQDGVARLVEPSSGVERRVALAPGSAAAGTDGAAGGTEAATQGAAGTSVDGGSRLGALASGVGRALLVVAVVVALLRFRALRRQARRRALRAR